MSTFLETFNTLNNLNEDLDTFKQLQQNQQKLKDDLTELNQETVT